MELTQYNFEISHLAGKQTLVADCLSRRSYENKQGQQAQTRHDEPDEYEMNIQGMTRSNLNSSPMTGHAEQKSHTKREKQQSEQQLLDTKQIIGNNPIRTCKEKSLNPSKCEKQTLIPAMQTGTNPEQTNIDVGKLQEKCDEIGQLYVYMKYDKLPNNTQ